MKIAINARFLSKPFTGIGQVTKNLFIKTAELDKENQYSFIVHEKIDYDFSLPENAEIFLLKEKNFRSAGAKKTWWEQVILPKFLIKEKFDVVIFPYPSNPWTSDFYKKVPKIIVMAHDCIPWKYKEYRKGILSKLYHSQTKKALGKAVEVLTVSNYSKKEIEKICGIESKKINVIYNDVDLIYKNDDAGDGFVLNKFMLKKDKYFLYCGGYDERKNVDFLVNEYNLFASKHDNISLVLAGGKLFEDELYKSIDKVNSTKGRIIKTGFLQAGELKDLYKNCLCYLNASKEEGFNIPSLEAANCEAPLIVSNIEVHREILKDGAIFADINKTGDFCIKMEKISDKDFRNNCASKSFEISKKYSWEKSAEQLKKLINLL
ncbi:MAG: glycosyltransferase family 1 protein [Candidatus Gracilibacteria bacterium]|jgi:glycosyltransferase involved in cell wall biosynthesis